MGTFSRIKSNRGPEAEVFITFIYCIIYENILSLFCFEHQNHVILLPVSFKPYGEEYKHEKKIMFFLKIPKPKKQENPLTLVI